MRLSTKGRYAVMAMVDLAQQGMGKPTSLAEIAERQEISLSYLEQLFAMLRKAGLVKSVRGPGGGYLLAHDRSETRIADIILAVDEPIRATRCPPGSAMGCRSDRTRCLTHDLWEELGNQIHLYLSSVSLADVCERRVLGRIRRLQRRDRAGDRDYQGHIRCHLAGWLAVELVLRSPGRDHGVVQRRVQNGCEPRLAASRSEARSDPCRGVARLPYSQLQRRRLRAFHCSADKGRIRRARHEPRR